MNELKLIKEEIEIKRSELEGLERIQEQVENELQRKIKATKKGEHRYLIKCNDGQEFDAVKTPNKSRWELHRWLDTKRGDKLLEEFNGSMRELKLWIAEHKL